MLQLHSENTQSTLREYSENTHRTCRATYVCSIPFFFARVSCCWLMILNFKVTTCILFSHIPYEDSKSKCDGIEGACAGLAQGSSLFLTNDLQLLKDFLPTKLGISQVLLQSISTKHTRKVSSLHYRVGGDFLLNWQNNSNSLGWSQVMVILVTRSQAEVIVEALGQMLQKASNHMRFHFYSFLPHKSQKENIRSRKAKLKSWLAVESHNFYTF